MTLFVLHYLVELRSILLCRAFCCVSQTWFHVCAKVHCCEKRVCERKILSGQPNRTIIIERDDGFLSSESSLVRTVTSLLIDSHEDYNVINTR